MLWLRGGSFVFDLVKSLLELLLAESERCENSIGLKS